MIMKKVIFDIAEKVQSLIDEHEPEIILLEDVANQTNSATHKKVIHVIRSFNPSLACSNKQ